MDRPITSPPTSDVFVSYSRNDREFVKQLCEALENAGRGAWVDWEDIPPAGEWLEEIYGAIEAADSFVCVLTPSSMTSRVCGLEVAHAVSRKKRLIPVVALDCEAATVPEALRRLNYVYMRSTDEFQTAFATLLQALDTDLPWVRLHTRYLVRAVDWDAKARDSGLLLRGKDLKEAELWLSDSARHESPEPTPLQIEYLVASRRADTRRQRIVLGSTVAALAISTLLTIWAIRERNVAQRQTQLSVANNLLVESQSERHVGASGAQLRVLLAIESLKRLLQQERASTDTLETLDAVASLRARQIGAVRMDSEPAGAQLSARGDRVATWDGNRIVVRHTLGMSELLKLEAESDVTAAAFDPRASSLAVGTDGLVHTYEWSTAGTSRTSFPCDGRPYALRFNASAAHLAALSLRAGESTRLCLWSVKEHRLLARLVIDNDSEDQRAGELAFSADSEFLAALLPGSGQKSTVVLLDVQSGEQRRSWELTARTVKLAFRGATLVVADDGAVWGWNARENREDSRWNLESKWRISDLSEDGRFAIVIHENTVSWVMDDFSYVRVGVHDAAGGIELAQRAHEPSGFTVDGHYLIDGHALLEIPSMRAVRFIPSSSQNEYQLVSADGLIAVTITGENQMRAWQLADAPELLGVALDPGLAEPRAFSARAPWSAIASGREVRLINLQNPATVTQRSAQHGIEALAFSEDARYLNGIGDGELTVWELPGLETRRMLTLGARTTAGKECGLLDAACRRAAQQPWRQVAASFFMSRDAHFVAWANNGELKVWTVADGNLVHAENEVSARPALLELDADLLIGHDDGRVTVLDTALWKSRAAFEAHTGRIDALVATSQGELVAAITSDERADAVGSLEHGASTWSFSLFSPQDGATGSSQSGRGTLGPWSADGTRVAVQSADDRIEIMDPATGARLPAAIQLSRSVHQRARALGFTSAGTYLLVESETPVTGGRSEPTLHIAGAGTGREILRMPVRDVNQDSIAVDRTVAYPDGFIVDSAHDLVASVVYDNADAYWSVSQDRAQKRLMIWRVSPAGELVPLLRVRVSGDIQPVAFSGGGRYLVTAPEFSAENAVSSAYAVRIWSIGLEERLQLACAAADANLSADEWNRYIGTFTGEALRTTCEVAP